MVIPLPIKVKMSRIFNNKGLFFSCCVSITGNRIILCDGEIRKNEESQPEWQTKKNLSVFPEVVFLQPFFGKSNKP